MEHTWRPLETSKHCLQRSFLTFNFFNILGSICACKIEKIIKVTIENERESHIIIHSIGVSKGRVKIFKYFKITDTLYF